MDPIEWTSIGQRQNVEFKEMKMTPETKALGEARELIRRQGEVIAELKSLAETMQGILAQHGLLEMGNFKIKGGPDVLQYIG